MLSNVFAASACVFQHRGIELRVCTHLLSNCAKFETRIHSTGVFAYPYSNRQTRESHKPLSLLITPWPCMEGRPVTTKSVCKRGGLQSVICASSSKLKRTPCEPDYLPESQCPMFSRAQCGDPDAQLTPCFATAPTQDRGKIAPTYLGGRWLICINTSMCLLIRIALDTNQHGRNGSLALRLSRMQVRLV
jgi:hypothetical protein